MNLYLISIWSIANRYRYIIYLPVTWWLNNKDADMLCLMVCLLNLSYAHRGQQGADRKWDGWTTSELGQDWLWRSCWDWWRTDRDGGMLCRTCPTLGSRMDKNRTEHHRALSANCLPVCLLVCLPACLSIMSACLPSCLPVLQSVCLSCSLCLSTESAQAGQSTMQPPGESLETKIWRSCHLLNNGAIVNRLKIRSYATGCSSVLDKHSVAGNGCWPCSLL